MMHGPCGKDDPNCPCMKEGVGEGFCSKHFPKDFSATTILQEDGSCLYARPDDGRTVTKYVKKVSFISRINLKINF